MSRFTEYAPPQGTAFEFVPITAGPDGNIWFLEEGATNPPVSFMGRITPAGSITEFPITNVEASWIASGPDGTVWYQDSSSDPSAVILRIGTTGGAPGNFTPQPDLNGSSWATGFTLLDGVNEWVAQIDDASRIPEFISRAFYTATSGRPGPVVLALPEDMLTDVSDVADAQPYKRQTVAPGEDSLRQFHELLTAARKPLVIVGGGGWSDQARRDLEAFAAAHEVPVSASFQSADFTKTSLFRLLMITYYVDNTTTPVTFWAGNNHGAAIIKLEPLD